MLFVSDIDQVGGAERAMLRLRECLVTHGIEATLLSTTGIRKCISGRFLNDYAKINCALRLPVWQRNHRTFLVSMRLHTFGAIPWAIRGAQVLHARGLTPATLMLAEQAQKAGIPTLCTPMASGPFGDVASLPLKLKLRITCFDHMAAMTQTMHAEIASVGYPTEQLSIIPNGVDTSFFQPPSDLTDKPSVVFVGQLRPEKRVDLLIRAWKTVIGLHPQARLTLVGGEHYWANYKSLAAELRITPLFISTTNAKGVLAQLQANSIFVAPGISEGMSNALLEAMAVGLAPIAADIPASREVITPEQDGLVYPADSSEGLAAQIDRLITDGALRHKLGIAARQTVLQRFTLESVVQRYIALYEQIAGEPHSFG